MGDAVIIRGSQARPAAAIRGAPTSCPLADGFLGDGESGSGQRPAALGAGDEVCRAGGPKNSRRAFNARCCLLSTIGRGRATLIGKAWNMAAIHKMESESWEQELELRSSVFAATSDQGTESRCADISVMRPVVDEDRSCFSLPEYLSLSARKPNGPLRKYIRPWGSTATKNSSH